MDTTNFIKSFKIENFRGVDSLELKDCKRVNIFAGENNSGKTTILEAIKFFGNPFDIFYHYRIAKRNLKRTDFINTMLQIFPDRELIPLAFEMTLENKQNYILKIVPSVKEEIQTTIEEKALNNLEKILKNYQKNSEDFFSDIYLKIILSDVSDKIEKKMTDFLFEDLTRPVTMTSIESKIKNLKNEYVGKMVTSNNYIFEYIFNNEKMIHLYNGYDKDIETNNKIIEKYKDYKNIQTSAPLDFIVIDDSFKKFDTLQEAGEKEHLLEILKAFEPKIEDIYFNSTSDLKIKIQDKKNDLDISNFGDGMKKVVILLSKLVAAKNGILLIDEMETGIHKSVMGKVFKEIINYSQKYNVQIFMTTHSREAIVNILEEFEEREELDEINIYHLDKNNDKLCVDLNSGNFSYRKVVERGGDLR